MKWMRQALNEYGDLSSIRQRKRVFGGSINDSYFVKTEKQAYFMKHHAEAPADFFQLEKLGLEHLASTGTIAIPEVFLKSDRPGEAYLMMEWIEGEKGPNTEAVLGERIAELHRTVGDYHGLERDSYIGLLPQPNGLYRDWLTYYRDRKLSGQIDYGLEQGIIPLAMERRLKRLLEGLDQWLPKELAPSYLHGDLWSGNWLVGPAGEPYVVDPSFFFGDRQMEIAFTELFGRFPEAFYEAYEATYPLPDFYEDVKPLYQLYYLIVHLNIFGQAYAGQIEAVLDRYIGK